MNHSKGASQGDIVLLLGLDQYLVRGVSRLGLTSVVILDHSALDNADMSFAAPDRVIVVDDYSRLDAALGGIERASLDKRSIALVTTSDEYAVVTAAALSDLLGCSRTPANVALRMRDKWLQKQAIQQAGLPVADGTLIEDIKSISDEMPELPYTPAVCKPVLGGGTESTFRVDNWDELSHRLQNDLSFHRQPSRQFLIEELQRGSEHHVNGIVRDGEVVFWQLFAYRESCLDMTISHRALLSVVQSPDEHQKLHKLVKPMLNPIMEALGYRAGVFHLELFIDEASGHVSFGECAGRQGGGMIQEAVHASSGVDLALEHLKAMLGLDPLPPPDHPNKITGYVQLPAPDGILLQHPSKREVEKQPDIIFADFYQQVGQTCSSAPSNTVVCLGYALAESASFESVTTALDQVQHWFTERVVTLPTGTATGNALRSWRNNLRGSVVIESNPAPREMFDVQINSGSADAMRDHS